jgi:hypothetical protein
MLTYSNRHTVLTYVKWICQFFKSILDDPDNALRQAVAETWKSKAFADVEVVCGVDGGILLSHRIVLVKKCNILANKIIHWI